MKFKLTPKKTAIFTILLFVVSVTLALCLAACDKDEPDDKKGNTHNGDGSIATSADYTYKTDISAVADALNTTDGYYLTLANKSYNIGADFLPDELVEVARKYCVDDRTYLLSGNAAFAAEALIREMRALGFDISITSAYRSYDYQTTLYNRYFEQEKAAHPDWSDEQIKKQVLTYSAYPGTSEHQTGLCVDLITSEMSGLWNYGSETQNNPYDKGFAETDEFEWLKDNAHKFGFILRYPENKTDITGYSYESWHYRFVGIDAATDIYMQGITLEEYLGK
ncbi:MAG: M15 family metallopeptidase [Clostridia bacterium]|nr:M15 family metallopeptidase [Clostridia bacterium]